MVRPALAATRAVDVLDFLAAHPANTFTLSELSRALRVNLASLLAVLQSLTDAGYVVRHPRHKTYELGPSLVSLGHAALTRHRVVDLARVEMRTLATDLSTECVASVVVGDEIVLLATEGRPQVQSADVRVGQRLPLVPPLGQIFLAWSAHAEVEAWLDRLGAAATEPVQRHLLGALAVVRHRGYALNRDSAARARLGAALAALADDPHDEDRRRGVTDCVTALDRDYELLELERDANYQISTLAAPVFDSNGRVAMALTVNGLSRVTGQEAARCGELLVATGRGLTKEIGGRLPSI